MANNHSPASSTRSQSNSKQSSPLATGPTHPFEIKTYTTPNVLAPANLLLNPSTLEKLRRITCPCCENECQDLSVCCEVCQQWFHAGCVKMSNTTYRAISGKENIKWFCTKCLDKKRPLAPSQASDDLRTQQWTMMMDRMTQVMDRMDRMENNLVTKDNLKDFEKQVESMVDSKIETAIEERIERDRRKLNLLFVNVQESTGDKEEKMEGDMKKVKEMIQKIVPEEAQRIKVMNPTRLGAVNAGSRPRLLKIQVESEEIKWNLIKNAYKLNTGKDWSDPTKQYINLDLTPKEREQNRLLREELRRRKAAGEKNIKIKGNQIVTFEPTQ